MPTAGQPMLNLTHSHDKQAAVAHYNAHAPAMQNLEFFYDWIIAVALQYAPQRTATVCDVGCGTGALLLRLHNSGYTVLHGADFAPACLALAHNAIPQATLILHDIEAAPLPAVLRQIVCDNCAGFSGAAASRVGASPTVID